MESLSNWDNLTLEEKVEAVKKRQDEELNQLEEENQYLRQQLEEWQEAYKMLESEQVDYEILKMDKEDLKQQVSQLQQQLKQWEALNESWKITDVSSLKLGIDLSKDLIAFEKEAAELSKRWQQLEQENPTLAQEAMKEYKRLEKEAQKQNDQNQ